MAAAAAAARALDYFLFQEKAISKAARRRHAAISAAFAACRQPYYRI